jgi:hypothetical protein
MMTAKTTAFLALVFLANYSSYGNLKLKTSTESINCENPFNVAKKNQQIEFGTNLSLRVINSTEAVAAWQIESNAGIEKTGNGNSTEPFLFSKPGNYTIIFSIPASGEHTAHADTAFVTVLPIKMIIHTEKAKLSATPIVNQPMNGMTLLIPIEILSYKNETAEFGPCSTNSTGIDGITASFSKTVTLKPGMHDLQFDLSGTPNAAGPIQIGFFNFLGEGFFYNFLISSTQ